MLNNGYCHDLIRDKMVQKLAYKETNDYKTWKKQLKEKFHELLGLEDIENNRAVDPKFTIESIEEKEEYTQTRFTFESEEGCTTPCYLLVPKKIKLEKYPVAIVMQGHSPGFHNSIGVIKTPDDENFQPRGQLAIQAVRNGFIGLAIEQRGMGERKEVREDRGFRCNYSAMTAIHMGRTIAGERIFDISCAIDIITEHFPMCDVDKILITGNSGGGTASYYAGCYDERIKICAPSCAFSSYKDSILDIGHCPCNHIPGAFKWFDMGDLAGLVAPRKLIVIAGVNDDIFPIAGVRRQFDIVKKVYEKENVASECELIETPREHWWCVDIVWPALVKAAKELNWF